MDNHNTKKRAALYVRVSTEDQREHGLSVDNQILALKEYCQKNGYSVFGVYDDAGISGRKSYKKRPALLRMLRDCQSKKIDVVLFTKLDRWFRSVPDYYACLEQMQGVPWRAIWEDYETETSSGVFKVNIMLSIAQAEADRTAERVRAINEYRRAQGKYIGSAPTGYRIKDGKLIVREEQRQAVTAFFDAYANYAPLRDCCRIAQESGVTIRRALAYKILSSPTYRGDAFGTACEPLCTPEQDAIIQKRLPQHIHKPRSGSTYMFQGLLYCGRCGTLLSAGTETYRGKKGARTFAEYHCRKQSDDFSGHKCKGCAISEHIAEKAILDALQPSLDAYNASISAMDEPPEKDYSAAVKKLREKQKRIAELYEDGMIDRAECRRKVADIKAQIAAMEQPKRQEAAALPEGWRVMYDSLGAEEKRIFWHRTVSKIVIHPAEAKGYSKDRKRKIEIYFA